MHDRPPEAAPGSPKQRGARTSSPAGSARGTGLDWSALLAAKDEGPADYDALADLFLGDSGPTEVRERREVAREGTMQPVGTIGIVDDRGEVAEPAAEPVDALILGHLPVLASPWAAQYARHIASIERGPVALIRARGEELTLEVIGGGEPSAGEADAGGAGLDAALSRLPESLARVIVRVDETSEPAIAELEGLSSLTMLTAADEAAIAASYRAIKGLAALDLAVPVRVAVMGAPADKGAEAAERIRKAAATFLGREPEVVACVSKIGPVRSTLVHRARLSGPAAPAIAELLRAVRSRLREPIAKPEPVRLVRPAPEPATRPVPISVDAVAAAPVPEVKPLPTEKPVLLSRHLGLEPIDIACPYAPGVELALDPVSNLHLVTHAGRGGVQALLTAAAWARDHAGLLAKALARTLPAEPTMHVVVADARDARPLRDTAVRVHLLVEVKAGSQSVPFCTEL